MSDHLLTNMRRSTLTLCLVSCLAFGLVALTSGPVRQPVNHSQVAPGSLDRSQESVARTENSAPTSDRQAMTGAEARQYLHETSEGQSLMQAITAARFGLSRQEHGPLGEAGAGYL